MLKSLDAGAIAFEMIMLGTVLGGTYIANKQANNIVADQNEKCIQQPDSSHPSTPNCLQNQKVRTAPALKP
jgi:hypothetical protein